MDINTLNAILIVVVPIVGHIVVATIVGALSKSREERTEAKFVNNTAKYKKMADDIAIIKAKLTSIEKCMSEKGKR